MTRFEVGRCATCEGWKLPIFILSILASGRWGERPLEGERGQSQWTWQLPKEDLVVMSFACALRLVHMLGTHMGIYFVILKTHTVSFTLVVVCVRAFVVPCAVRAIVTT